MPVALRLLDSLPEHVDQAGDMFEFYSKMASKAKNGSMDTHTVPR